MPEGVDLSDPRKILTPETRGLIPTQVLDKITEALSSSIVHTFAWAIIPSVIAFVAALAHEQRAIRSGPGAGRVRGFALTNKTH